MTPQKISWIFFLSIICLRLGTGECCDLELPIGIGRKQKQNETNKKEQVKPDFSGQRISKGKTSYPAPEAPAKITQNTHWHWMVREQVRGSTLHIMSLVSPTQWLMEIPSIPKVIPERSQWECKIELEKQSRPDQHCKRSEN